MSLEYLDTLIAFATVMLGLSLIVTTLTQMVSGLLGLRGTNLLWGLKALIVNIYPDSKEKAHEIAESVLRHPLISDSSMSIIRSKIPVLRRWQLASHVTVGEFGAILNKIAGETGQGDLKTAMQKLVDKAVPAEAGEVAADFQFWFDTAMSRTAQRFRMHTRLWTVFFSILLCLGLHMDSLSLYTQLSSDAELRAGLLSASTTLMRKAQQPPASGEGREAVQQLAEQAQAIQKTLEKSSLVLIPEPYPAPWYGPYGEKRHLLGVFFTIALLALGAPFWFNVLKSLSSLKPLLATQQEDAGAHS